jgi:hypothetical protein
MDVDAGLVRREAEAYERIEAWVARHPRGGRERKNEKYILRFLGWRFGRMLHSAAY